MNTVTTVKFPTMKMKYCQVYTMTNQAMIIFIQHGNLGKHGYQMSGGTLNPCRKPRILLTWERSYRKASKEKRKDLPGYNFYEFLKTFAVKSLEVIRDGCMSASELKCPLCIQGCASGTIERVPEPFPNYGTPSYLHINETPKCLEDGYFCLTVEK